LREDPLKLPANESRENGLAGDMWENGADLSRELNPMKYQHFVRYSPQAVHFPG
jgi:hypothetical protein